MQKLLLLFLLLIFSCGKTTIYDITFVDLGGREVKIEHSGKPLLLYVWTGTCIGHQEDMRLINEHFSELSRRYKVVSLAVFMKPEDVREFLKDNGINPKFIMLADPEGKITSLVKLVFLPATLLFDESGELIRNYPRLPLKELLKG
ncbi:TlpA family protein disulfide reductase [Aquifex sp.]